MYHQRSAKLDLLGAPIRLRWGGWGSDTYLLQRSGWKFSVEESLDHYDHQRIIHLAATAPDGSMVIAGKKRIHMEVFLQPEHFYKELHHIGFEMQQFFPTDRVRVFQEPMSMVDSWKGLSEMDIHAPREIAASEICMREFKVFNVPVTAEKQIFVPNKNVDELFNEILKLQYVEQQDIKSGLYMPQAKPIIKAQILTLAA